MQKENSLKAAPLASFIVYSLLLFSLLYAWQSQKPSANEFQDQAPTAFSQQRVLQHVTKIAQQPHFTGSSGHTEVQKYIVNQLESLGMEVEVQRTLGSRSEHLFAAKVENIVARLPANSSSKNTGKALLLLSHYDSATTSALGASDAGSGVATILEAMRFFIANNNTHRNDIIVLIDDAEEQGLLGAQAFVSKHRFMKNVGTVLNFEARGSGGPSFMFMETNKGNEQLLQAFIEANVQFPLSNSLLYSLYKTLPNNSDLTIFREQANISSYMFSFIDDHFDYHTEQDSVARLDRSSLNHQAHYLLPMLSYLANKDLSALQSDIDLVYFNFANLGVIHYPFSWVLPLFVLATLLFCCLLFVGLKRQKLKPKHIVISAIPTFGSLIAALIIGTYGWKLLLIVFPQFGDIPQKFTYNGHWIIACLMFLSVAISVSLCAWVKRRLPLLNNAEFWVLPIILWLLINLPLATHFTGGGFFIIPVYSALMVFAASLFFNNDRVSNRMLATLIFIPALMIFGPLIPTFAIGLGLPFLAVTTVLTVMLSALLIPSLMALRGLKYLLACLTLGFIVATYGLVHHSGYSPDKKQPTGVNYLYDTQSQQGFVFSFNQRLDGFTKQFFSDDYSDGKLINDLYPVTYYHGAPKFAEKIDSINIPSADYSAVQHLTKNDIKQITLTVRPKRPINILELSSNVALTVHSISFNDERVTSASMQPEAGVVFRYVVTDSQPVSFEFSYSSEKTPEFRILETSYDLAGRWPGFIPRSSTQMPMWYTTDATIISQPVVF